MFHLFQKCLNPRLKPTNGIKQCYLLLPLSFKNSLKANINIYYTSDLNKYELDLAKKNRRLF